MSRKKRNSLSFANSRYETLEPRQLLATCDTPLVNLNHGVAVSDDATGIGYMLYSEERVQERFAGIAADNADHFIAVRLDGVQWQYNNDVGWVDFSPHHNDRLAAEVFFESDRVANTVTYGPINVEGISQAGSDDLVFVGDRFGGSEDEGEYEIFGSCIGAYPSPIDFEISAETKLQYVQLATLHYESMTMQFPDLAIFDDTGSPLLSWRVQMLPHLGLHELHAQFNLEEAWDSPHNLSLLDQMPDVFKSPNFDSPTKTVFQAVGGEGTVFPLTSERIGFGQILDGSANTLQLVETNAELAVEWTRPVDWYFNENDPLAGLGEISQEGFAGVTASGNAYTVSADVDPENFTNFVMIADGNVVDLFEFDPQFAEDEDHVSTSLRNVALAALNFESAYMRFPRHAIYDETGTTPLLSWRVQILPFIEQNNLYQMFNLDEPWDSPHNLSLLPLMPQFFAHSDVSTDGMTNLLGVSGENTIFEITSQGNIGFGSITDGSSNTLMFVEGDPSQAVEWTRPLDLEFDPANPSAGLKGTDDGGFWGAFADGSVHFVPDTEPDSNIANMLQRNDGQFVDLSEIKPASESSVLAQNNLRQLALGALNYESAHMRFPAHAIYDDAETTPLLSWRVAILPFIDQNQLYSMFRLDEPWNSPHNLSLLPLMPQVFADSGVNNAAGLTNILALNGENTMFPTDDRGTSFGATVDGSSNTILFVKANDDRAVEWTRPADISFDPANPWDGLDNAMASGFHAVFADGSTHVLHSALDDETIANLAQRNDGMVVDPSFRANAGLYAAGRTNLLNNFRLIALGSLNYESAHMEFPPHAIYDVDGNSPLLSWRVRILPFLEQGNLYSQFHFDEPWDSPHNLSLLPLMPDFYAHPLIEDGMTLVQAVTGPGTIFPLEDRGTRFGQITDGSSNTLLFVQANLDRAVPWTAPDDLYYDPDAPNADPSDGIGDSYFGLGTVGVLADASSHFFSECLSDESWYRLIQKGDGENGPFKQSNFGCNGGTVEPRPSVGSIDLNAGEAQNSIVSELSLTFDGSVDFEPDAFSIVQRSDGDGNVTAVPVMASFTCSVVDDSTVVNITFDSHVRNNSGALEDGNYQLHVDGSKVFRSGTDLALGTDVVFGDTEGDGFFSLYGDTTGDRSVNVFDLLDFRRAWQTSAGAAEFDPALDYNDDGTINVFDLLQFRKNYQDTLAFV